MSAAEPWRGLTAVPHGSNATWRVTERLSDSTERVAGMLSYDTDENESLKAGDITLSATRTLLHVLQDYSPGSEFIGYRLRPPQQTVGKSVIAALRSDKAAKKRHFTMSMGGTGYVMVPVEKDTNAFAVKRLADGVRLDEDKPQAWATAKSQEVCRITWSPQAEAAFLRETLNYGYEIVFDKIVDLELLLFCLWLLNCTYNKRKAGRQYGPLPIDRNNTGLKAAQAIAEIACNVAGM